MRKLWIIIICFFVPIIVFADNISGGGTTPTPAGANDILNNFTTQFSSIPSNLIPACMIIASFAITMECVNYLLKIGISNANFAELFVKKAIQLSVFVWIINNYTMILNWIAGAFVALGTIAAGNINTSTAAMPDNFLDLLYQMMTVHLGLNFIAIDISQIFTMIALIIAGLAMGWVALQIILCWLEFWFLGGLAVAFVGFGLWEKTAFYFEKVINLWVMFGAKLMVMTCFSAIAYNIVKGAVIVEISKNMGITAASNLLMGSVCIAILATKLPSLASGLLSGTSSMSAGGLASSAMGAVSMGAGAATGGAALLAGGAAGAAASKIAGGSGLSQIAGAIGGASKATDFAHTMRDSIRSGTHGANGKDKHGEKY